MQGQRKGSVSETALRECWDVGGQRGMGRGKKGRRTLRTVSSAPEEHVDGVVALSRAVKRALAVRRPETRYKEDQRPHAFGVAPG